MADNEIVVENRMHEGLLGLIVVHIDVRGERIAIVGKMLFGILTLDADISAPDIEVVPVIHTGQIDDRREILGVGIGNDVIAVERAIGRGVDSPAKNPVGAEVESAHRAYSAAELTVAAQGFSAIGEHAWVLLENTRRSDAVGAVQNLVAPLALHQQALA